MTIKWDNKCGKYFENCSVEMKAAAAGMIPPRPLVPLLPPLSL